MAKTAREYCERHAFALIVVNVITFVHYMLNKNTLGVKKCEANQKPQWLYKRPKTLISSKAKKLNILLRILSLK